MANNSTLKKRTLLLVILILLPVCLALAAAVIVLSLRLSALSGKLTAQQSENKGLSSQITKINGEYSSLESDYSKLQNEKADEKKNPPKVAYLTFDDGPSKLTGKILDALKANGVHGTFFVIGLNAEKNPDALNQILADGNVVGIHSWTHQYDVIYKSTANFMSDFNELREYIKQVTGVDPTICRFPGGTNNTVSFHYDKHIMQQITPMVEQAGVKPYDWNVDSEDAQTHVPTKDQIVSTVIRESKQYNNAVILMHDADQHQSSVDAIPEIVSQLKALGYKFSTLSNKTPTVMFKPS